jgi:predicted transcriptional regulator
MLSIDPKITVAEALQLTNGNQSELGRMLGISRASVSAWLVSGREFIPPLQAYRFRALSKRTSRKAN